MLWKTYFKSALFKDYEAFQCAVLVVWFTQNKAK